jgi:hypothetical protein
MITRPSVDDMIQPSWFGSNGAAIFFTDTLHTNAWDLLRQFEMSCCASKYGKSLITLGRDNQYLCLDVQLAMEVIT